jgi:uncharacterized protein
VIVPDVNLLVHAMNTDSEHHDQAWEWWRSALNGSEHVGLAWSVLTGYLRVTTHPRIMSGPQSFEVAINDVRQWLAAPITISLTPGPDHLRVMENLMAGAGRGGDLTPDVHLAALACENGGTICSQDADFARFEGVRWINPCA